VTIREATKDDVIPLSEPLTASDGREITSIPVKKGQVVMLGLNTFNHTKTIFGDDAEDFRPERWLESDLATKIRGFTTWAPLLT
jgi:cytochrome P450